jgi:hypothetical protein
VVAEYVRTKLSALSIKWLLNITVEF